MAAASRDRLRFGDFAECAESLGPGKRSVLWVRGCSLNCRGCTTPQLIPKGNASHEVPIADILARISDAKTRHGIEGVSFSGGEPFEQAEALADLARSCRSIGLTVISWSGYTLEELKASALPGVPDLLSAIDVLIDGRYVRDLGGVFPLRGSSNQRFHLFTEAYRPEDFKEANVEFRIATDGSAQSIGVIDDREVATALKLLGLD